MAKEDTPFFQTQVTLLHPTGAPAQASVGASDLLGVTDHLVESLHQSLFGQSHKVDGDAEALLYGDAHVELLVTEHGHADDGDAVVDGLLGAEQAAVRDEDADVGVGCADKGRSRVYWYRLVVYGLVRRALPSKSPCGAH